MGLAVALYELQKVELKISEVQNEIQKIQDEILGIELDFQARQKEIQEAPQNIVKVQAELKAQNLELSSLQEKQKAHQAKFGTGKHSSRDYARFEAEKKAFEKQQAKFEEDILALMNREAELKKTMADSEKDLEALKGDVEKQVQEKTQALEGLRWILEERQKEKEQVATQIPENLVSEFYRLYENMDGLAVAEVDNEACAGCFMGLSTAVIDHVRNHDDVSYCDSCGRMLFCPGAGA